MPSQPPRGVPVPSDGTFPSSALRAATAGPFGLYVHVPYCRVRCGYCDFNTYVPGDLLAASSGASSTITTYGDDPAGPGAYADLITRELHLASTVLGEHVRPLNTIFIGGGTPTLLPTDALTAIIDQARDVFTVAPDVEITVEANPDTVTTNSLAALAAAGVTRLSIGMQSAVPHVLATLDRTHHPANVARAVAAARDAGLTVSLDLIYGTPGETLDDWRASLDSAISLEPDHISAYALVVEEGTRMGGQVARGELPTPHDDDEADKYELADARLHAAGYGWYEVSNWARTDAGVCRHNVGYWRGGHWWGAGPGAHGHLGGVRWWNVRHPRAYADRLLHGTAPGHEREILTADQQYDEHVLLRSRLAEGLPVTSLRAAGRAAVAGLIADGLIEAAPALGAPGAITGAWDTSGLGVSAPSDTTTEQSAETDRRRVVLTVRGRLLADTVVHRLLAGDTA